MSRIILKPQKQAINFLLERNMLGELSNSFFSFSSKVYLPIDLSFIFNPEVEEILSIPNNKMVLCNCYRITIVLEEHLKQIKLAFFKKIVWLMNQNTIPT